MEGSETILVVEDDVSGGELTAKFPGLYKYNVICAKDVDEAMRVAEPANDKIHLLITDIVMPKMSGRDLSDHIRKMHPNIKILFISGYTDDVILHHGVLDADVNFLPKPFGPEEPVRKVRHVLDS